MPCGARYTAAAVALEEPRVVQLPNGGEVLIHESGAGFHVAGFRLPVRGKSESRHPSIGLQVQRFPTIPELIDAVIKELGALWSLSR